MRISQGQLTETLARFSYEKSMGNLSYQWDYESERVKNEYRAAMQPYAELIADSLFKDRSIFSGDIKFLIRVLATLSVVNFLILLVGSIIGLVDNSILVIVYGVITMLIMAASLLLFAFHNANNGRIDY